jgi:hypothetical protein
MHSRSSRRKNAPDAAHGVNVKDGISCWNQLLTDVTKYRRYGSIPGLSAEYLFAPLLKEKNQGIAEPVTGYQFTQPHKSHGGKQRHLYRGI